MFQTGGGVSSANWGKFIPLGGMCADGKDVILLGWFFFLSTITLCPRSVAKPHPERAVPPSCEVFFWHPFSTQTGQN